MFKIEDVFPVKPSVKRRNYVRNAILYLRSPNDASIEREDNFGDKRYAKSYYDNMYNFLTVSNGMQTQRIFCRKYGPVNKMKCLEQLSKYFPKTGEDNLSLVQWVYRNITINDIDENDDKAKLYMEKWISKKADVFDLMKDDTLLMPFMFCRTTYPKKDPTKRKSKKLKLNTS